MTRVITRNFSPALWFLVSSDRWTNQLQNQVLRVFFFGTILGPRVLVCIFPRKKKASRKSYMLTLHKDEGEDKNGQGDNQCKGEYYWASQISISNTAACSFLVGYLQRRHTRAVYLGMTHCSKEVNSSAGFLPLLFSHWSNPNPSHRRPLSCDSVLLI